MRYMHLRGMLAGLLAVGNAGCVTALESGDPAEPPAPAQLEAPMIPTLESITESVLEDASRRTGIGKSSLKVDGAVAVTWADGSLGCPKPGMSYTMALVPGYQIMVRAGEQVLDYHASRRGHFVLCPAGMAVEPAPQDAI